MKHFRTFSLSLLLIVAAGCKDYLDINTNPNSPVAVPPSTLMAGATNSLGFYSGSDLHRYGALFTQQFSGQGNPVAQTRFYDLFVLQPADVNNAWSGYYQGYLINLERLITATAGTSPYYSGMARIMKAYTFQILCDAWGDVPYTQAFDIVNFPQPRYDDDAQVYTAIYALLDQGIAELNAPSSVLSPSADDFIYGGNRARWQKFARSIQLRMALHYSQVNPTQATTLLTALAALPATDFINSNAENAGCAFFNTPNQQNSIHQFEVSRTDQFYPSATLIDSMNARQDPRRRFYFTMSNGGGAAPTSPNSVYLGNANGTVAQIATPLSRMHTYLRGDTTGTSAPVTGRGRIHPYTGAAPIRLLTYAEVCFIRAEAALNLGVTFGGTAQSWYTAGITASQANAGVPGAETTAYLATPSGTLSGSASNQLKRIICEKWIANYGVAIEPWTDWRRTGFPVLTAPPGANFGALFPGLLPYAQGEIQSNPKTPARPNITTARAFWDTRP